MLRHSAHEALVVYVTDQEVYSCGVHNLGLRDAIAEGQDPHNELLHRQRDGIGRAVEEVIERERRNLQRASAVLASLTVAVMYEEEQIAAVRDKRVSDADIKMLIEIAEWRSGNHDAEERNVLALRRC
jgi:hypothetical protein